MEAAKAAAKPSINVNQGQTSTEDDVAKGTKRKLTNEIFDQKAVKKGCINYPNNDNRRVQEVSKGKMPANNKFLTENSGPSDKYRNIMAEKVDYRFSWATSNKNPPPSTPPPPSLSTMLMRKLATCATFTEEDLNEFGGFAHIRPYYKSVTGNARLSTNNGHRLCPFVIGHYQLNITRPF